MPAFRRCLAALCLLAAAAPPVMGGGLGDAVAAVEQRLAALPEAQAGKAVLGAWRGEVIAA